MTAPSPLIVEQAGAIARLRFNRPGVLNAMDVSMAQALLEACQRLQTNSTIRVIVISGEGRAFMAGGDLARFHADLPNAAHTAKALIEPFHAALAILAEMPQPVLASINGHVAGAGVSVALACDLAIAADNVCFNTAYAKVGASPDGSQSWTLPRLVGLRKSIELMMLADDLDATEALRLGLVNKVVTTGRLEEETLALGRRLAQGPTLAYGRIKRLLRDSFTSSLQEQLDAESLAFGAGSVTDDFREGLAAFFERRPARFSGS